MDLKDRDEKRKSKLKEMREKYGITSTQDLEVGANYKDRADERRKTKGSDHGNFSSSIVLYLYKKKRHYPTVDRKLPAFDK